jgi:hypothetical protein
MTNRYDRDEKQRARGAESSAIRANIALPAAQAASGVVKKRPRPAALVGLRIPSRQQHTRDLVVRLYEENVHLQRADLLAVVRYAELCWKFRKLAELQERMGDTSGYLKNDLEPRKILAELRGLADSLLRHEAALALVPSARAALGVDVGRLRSMDAASRVAQLRAAEGQQEGG